MADPLDTSSSPNWGVIEREAGRSTEDAISFLFNKLQQLEALVGRLKFTRSGLTSVADGGTIAHGLNSAPTRVNVTATVSGEFVSVTAVSRTTFTVAIKTHANGAGTTQPVYWVAEL